MIVLCLLLVPVAFFAPILVLPAFADPIGLGAIWCTRIVSWVGSLGFLIAALSMADVGAAKILALFGAMLALALVPISVWQKKLLISGVVSASLLGVTLNIVLLINFYRGINSAIGGLVEAIAVVIMFVVWIKDIEERQRREARRILSSRPF